MLAASASHSARPIVVAHTVPATPLLAQATAREAAVIGLLCALFWATLWGALYRFLLPKLSQQLLATTCSTAIIQRGKTMLSEIGFMRATSGATNGARDGFTDRQIASLFAYLALTTCIHMLAGLLSLPAAFLGWDEAGSHGRLGFFTATFLMLGWSFFVAGDEFLRCFLPATGGLSGFAIPCPRSFWALMACTYHPFWLTLILPANELSAGTFAYHTLVCAMTLGGGVQYASRLLALILDAKRSSRVAHRLVVIAGAVAAVVGRCFFFFPSVVECVQRLHEQAVATGDAFLIASLLTSCFNVAATLDAAKSLMWCSTAQAQVREGSSQARPLRSGADSTPDSRDSSSDAPAATLESEPSARSHSKRGRSSRRPPRPKRKQSGPKPHLLTDNDEMTFGFATAEELGVENADIAEGVDDDDDDDDGASTISVNDARMGDDGTFDTRKFDRPSRRHNGDGEWSPTASTGPKAAAQPQPDHAADERRQRLQREVEEARREVRQQQQQQQQQAAGNTSGPTTFPASGQRGAHDTAQRMRDHSDLYARGRLNKVGHYVMLGIGKEATEAEVKRAFHQLSRKWHPDKNPDDADKADAIFKSVKEAYECLSDPVRRKRYDKFFAPA